MVHDRAGHAVAVSELLFTALATAYDVARQTFGAVDPTVGNAIAALGYDRDFDEIADETAPPAVLQPVAGYWHVQLGPADRTVRIPRGVRLDLGATAKALAADRAAARLAEELGTGVLVSLGGDVAVAGPPPSDGWAIGIAAESATPAELADQVVAIRSGGLASSSTSVRRWTAGGRAVHHIVDPLSGDSAEPYWTLVSAVGASCVAANAVTTAAMVWGEGALELLPSFGQAMRLVRHDGHIIHLNGWPEEQVG
jgi:thiamine biosynthesis lipoprotein